ncbi:hypothetical protein VTN96DRAFT_10120 [Rasamsonia emersonii]
MCQPTNVTERPWIAFTVFRFDFTPIAGRSLATGRIGWVQNLFLSPPRPGLGARGSPALPVAQPAQSQGSSRPSRVRTANPERRGGWWELVGRCKHIQYAPDSAISSGGYGLSAPELATL